VARARDEAERELPEVPGQRPGVFVVDGGAGLIGAVMLERRDLGRPVPLRPESGQVDLGYLFLPNAGTPRRRPAG
jgi:hypothetical protein